MSNVIDFRTRRPKLTDPSDEIMVGDVSFHFPRHIEPVGETLTVSEILGIVGIVFLLAMFGVYLFAYDPRPAFQFREIK